MRSHSGLSAICVFRISPFCALPWTDLPSIWFVKASPSQPSRHLYMGIREQYTEPGGMSHGEEKQAGGMNFKIKEI